jgi:acyl carrier protein
MTDSVDAAIIAILAKHAKLNEDDVTPETLLQGVGVDSLLMVEIIFELEEAFDISIPDPDFVNEENQQFKTVADVIRIVKDIIEEQKTTP